MKTNLFLILSVLSFNIIFAQDVTGTVTDSSGNPIPGANIIEKNTSNGTTSDLDGTYSITVGANATLVYSYIGFNTKEVAVNGQTSINVTLDDGVSLDEIVLTGSRTAPRSNRDTPLPIDVLDVSELVATG